VASLRKALRSCYSVEAELAIAGLVLLAWQVLRIPLEGRVGVSLDHAGDVLRLEHALSLDIEASVIDRVSGSELEVVMRLTGGTIVQTTTTNIQPNTGHIHLSVDGRLVSMTYGVLQPLDLSSLKPGTHTLTAQFVAADHGPFDPPVVATATFVKDG